MGYPDQLVDEVLRYAGRPVDTALEVGAGTGKATRLFAGRSIEVTALEPDLEMARVLARTTRGLPVQVVVATFETFPVDRRFDLLYAAAAWHWTDPATRWSRTAELLSPGGVLALFGGRHAPQDPELTARVEEIERRMLPGAEAPVGSPWSIEDIGPVDGLVDAEERNLPRAATTTAADFASRLATASAYLILTDTERAEVLSHIRAALPDRFEIDTTVRVSLARRV
jgi:SAM-dependent methyltransferase